ncbi:hypothetical protein AB0N87_28365 [Streptomyces sp. NPDC093228]|uniref:hypothetical protein n=1 Tax=Streptomyces sp. NPDC093228 TaxID=3155070 RepID=UPI003412A791
MRRLPGTGDGHSAFVSEGDGLVSRMADLMEDQTLEMAEELVTRAQALVNDFAASRAELRSLLRLLAAQTTEAVGVARLRAERLSKEREEERAQRSVDAAFPAVAAFLAEDRARDADR